MYHKILHLCAINFYYHTVLIYIKKKKSQGSSDLYRAINWNTLSFTLFSKHSRVAYNTSFSSDFTVQYTLYGWGSCKMYHMTQTITHHTPLAGRWVGKSAFIIGNNTLIRPWLL